MYCQYDVLVIQVCAKDDGVSVDDVKDNAIVNKNMTRKNRSIIMTANCL